MEIMSWKRQMNESFRWQTLITYYKEDLVNVLREFYTLEMLQEVLHIDDRNKDKLVEILRTGLKKEELNVILFNSQNITQEALENYKKPSQRRIPVIIYREVADLGEMVVDDDSERKSLDGGNHKIRRTRDDLKEFLQTREEKKVNYFNAEGIIASSEELKNAIRTPTDSKEIPEAREELSNIMLTPTDLKEIPRAREEKKGNYFNAEGIIASQEENVKIIDAREKEKTIFDAQNDISTFLGTIEKEKEYPEVDENMKETFLLSLNHIQKIHQSKTMFQEQLKSLLRTQVSKYENNKSTHRLTDKNYQFIQQHVVPLCNYYQIPFDSIRTNLAREGTHAQYVERRNEQRKSRNAVLS